MMKEFKEFAMKGNVVDLAVGIIIGGAFGKIVSSLVADVIMPPIGLIVGQVDFASLFVSLTGQSYASIAAAKEAGAPTINYGLFLNAVIDFILVAFAVFLLVKQVNRMRQPAEPPPAPPAPEVRECPFCLSSIPAKAQRCAHCTSALAAAAGD